MPNDYFLAPYDAEQQAINRRRALALALQQQAFEPIESPPIAGALNSPWQGIAKMVQALIGGIQNSRLDKEQKALNEDILTKRKALIAPLIESQLPQVQGPQASLPAAPTMPMA